MHSKKSSIEEIEVFMKEWSGRHPVVIVPTKYYNTPKDQFRKLGVDAVIWANHNLRAAIKAMQDISTQILKDANPYASRKFKLLMLKKFSDFKM